MNLIFLGKQGVGKGTYAQRVSQKYSLPQISTGDLLREEAKKPTPLGGELKKRMAEGHLISDQLVMELLVRRLAEADCQNGFILDGYPRTDAQAKLLDQWSIDSKRKLDLVVLFNASDQVLMDRISGRIQCRLCGKIYHTTNLKPKVEGKCDIDNGELFQRDDDKPEAIKKRFADYEKLTKPIVDFYRKKGVLFEVDAAGAIDPILEQVYKKLDSWDSKKKK